LEKDFWQAYKGKGVVVIGVAIWAEGDAFQRAREFVNKHKLTYTVLVDASEDGEVAQLYGVEGVRPMSSSARTAKSATCKPALMKKGSKRRLRKPSRGNEPMTNEAMTNEPMTDEPMTDGR
jgi:hypothetical protein